LYILKKYTVIKPKWGFEPAVYADVMNKHVGRIQAEVKTMKIKKV
jgi:hypothetical protein